MSPLSVAVVIAVVLSLLPMIAFAIECASALLFRARNQHPDRRPRCAVLIPARNEEHVIGSALSSLRDDLRPDDTVLVVADNCTDATADVAHQWGAMVLERRDPGAAGKDHTLVAGITHLEADPPEVLVLLDADTELESGALDLLVAMATETGRPVQGAYRMAPPATGAARDLVSAFAVTVKNVVRPMGLERLGLPCPLTGSGIAIPWSVVRQVPLATGGIVEDVRMGIDFAVGGFPPRFCSEARIRGHMPADRTTARTQRRRWEHGQIANLVQQVPRLLGAALRQRRADLLAMAIDVAIPPLALLTMGWLGATGLAIASGLITGNWIPAALAAAGGVVFLATIVGVRARFPHDHVPLWALLSIPGYVLGKIPMYLALSHRRQREWESRPPPRFADSAEDVILAGARVRSCTEAGCVSHVIDELAHDRGGWIITMNIDHLRRYCHEEDYVALAGRASFIVADGMPLIWASRIHGTALPERVAGSRLIYSLSAAAARENRSMFLLGGAPDSADAASQVLRTLNPGLHITGTSRPEPGFENRPGEIEEVVKLLTDASPDIVLVGLGNPKQELLIDLIRHHLPATWWIGVGVSFSYVAGYLPVAPRWVQSAGLEWVHRLVFEPRRLAHRYFVDDLPFAIRFLTGAIHKRLTKSGPAAGRDFRAP